MSSTCTIRRSHTARRLAIICGLMLLPASVQAVAPEYAVPAPGSQLVQTRELHIPRGGYAVYIQNGEVLGYRDVDQYYANCVLETRRPLDRALTLAPGEYTITASRRYTEWASLPFRHAAFQPVNSGGDSLIFSLEMRLRSERYPQVERMTCSHWGEFIDSDYLTLERIRKTLAPVFELRLR